MSKKDEALKLALEALEEINRLSIGENAICLPAEIDTAMDAIREALAEPVEWLTGCPECGMDGGCDCDSGTWNPPAQQEPVAWVCEASSSDEKHAIDYWPGDVDDLPIGTKLYTSPPASKPWVGLTDEEIDTWNIVGHESLREFVRAIEAKLKEKNT